MNTDLKTIIWAEIGVIILTLGMIDNKLTNGNYLGISLTYIKLSASLFLVKFFLKIDKGVVLVY